MKHITLGIIAVVGGFAIERVNTALFGDSTPMLISGIFALCLFLCLDVVINKAK